MLFKRRKKPTPWAKLKNFIYPRKGLVRAYKYLFKRVSRIPDKTHAIAIGAACGVGISMTPFIGFQFLLTAVCAFILRGNIPAGLIATAVGNPITFPFIWIGSYRLGAFLMGEPSVIHGAQIPFVEIFKDMKESVMTLNFEILQEKVLPIFNPMIIGGIIMGIVFGIITYYLIIGMIDEYKRKHHFKMQQAIDKIKNLKNKL